MGRVQQAACLFDFERETGYCIDHVGDHRIIIESMYQVWSDLYDYTVTLEILVNGLPGDNGVYFTAENVGFIGSPDTATICNDIDNTANLTFAATCQAGTNCAAAGTCSEVNHTRLTTALSPGNLGTIGANQRFIWVDVPQMAYNTATAGTMVVAGEAVSIRVTLGASNPGANVCGTDQFTVGPYTVPVGTFGTCGNNFGMVFPYFTDNTAPWWSGIAVVNMSDNDGAATVYVYEDDGTRAQLALNVTAHQMEVYLTADLFNLAGVVTTPAGATLGNDRSYMVVCSNFNMDGFGFMANSEDGTSMGYLPRTAAVVGLPVECQ
jgi:hypothetical protein